MLPATEEKRAAGSVAPAAFYRRYGRVKAEKLSGRRLPLAVMGARRLIAGTARTRGAM